MSEDREMLAGWLGQMIDDAETDGHRITINVAAVKRIRAVLSGVPEGAASDLPTSRGSLFVEDLDRAVPSPEPLEPMCMSCGATESYRCAECGSDDPTGYSLSRLAAPQPVPEDET